MTQPLPTAADIPAWHVIADQITKQTTINQAGSGLVEVHHVPYRIDSGPAKGYTGYVNVPDEDYTPAGVQEAVESDVVNNHGVAQLGKPVA